MNGGEHSILLAEDSDDDAYFFSRALIKTGCPCVCERVKDGEHAIRHLRMNQRHWHLLFLDLKMPHKGGFEVLEWLRQQPFKERIEAIVLSGSIQEADVLRAKELGALEYLTKPISHPVLAGFVNRWREKCVVHTSPDTTL